MSKGTVGIVVGGGPAPGIHAVIGAATIAAINAGFDVIGFYDGFKWLASDFVPERHSVRLDIQKVARIHFDGGSILRTSRTNLMDPERMKTHTLAAPDREKVARVLSHLNQLGVTHLLTIGGDDTSLSARFVRDSTENRLPVVHVPKTIDNDIPLPHDMPTFGFSTARFIGTQLVKNLMRDSQTTGRWYLIEAMGRSSGSLALSIGMSAGATLTLIPEEFPDRTTVSHIVDVLETSIIKRRALGRPDGVALMAEGLAYKLGDKEELEKLLGFEVPVDAFGHPRLAELNLSDLIKRQLVKRFKERGQSMTIVDHELGYELRSADPTPFDMGYCRMLGYFAVELLQRPEAAQQALMVSIVNGNLQPIDLHDLVDPSTNRTRVRKVDTDSDVYEVARAYMIRLEKRDFDDEQLLTQMAADIGLSPEDFRDRFAEVVNSQTSRQTPAAIREAEESHDGRV